MFRMRVSWIVLIALLVIACGGYFYYNNVYHQAQEPVEEPQVAQVQEQLAGQPIHLLSGMNAEVVTTGEALNTVLVPLWQAI